MGLKFPRQDQLLLMNTTDRELIEVFPEYSREELRSYKRELLDTAKAVRGKKKEQYEKLLEKENKRLQDEIATKDAELKAALAISEHKSEYTIKTVPNGKLSCTPIILASDFHCDELIYKRKVNGLNDFNLETADKRIAKFFGNAIRLIKMVEKEAKVDAITLALLGDFVSSNIHEELLENTSLRPIEAILWVYDRLESGIKLIRETFPNYPLVVPCCTGNHSRINKKLRISTESGNSLEFFLYSMLKKQFPEIEFLVSESYMCYIDIYGKKCRYMHGHHCRYWGGVGGLTIPLNKAIHMWNEAKYADYTFLGHFHTMQSGSQWRSNGSLIGYSPFSIAIKSSYEPPVQKFMTLLSNGMISNECPIILE